MATKRARGLVQMALNQTKQQRLATAMESATVTSTTPSLDAVDENFMHAAFQMEPIAVPVDPFEKCSEWLRSNDSPTQSVLSVLQDLQPTGTDFNATAIEEWSTPFVGGTSIEFKIPGSDLNATAREEMRSPIEGRTNTDSTQTAIEEWSTPAFVGGTSIEFKIPGSDLNATAREEMRFPTDGRTNIDSTRTVQDPNNVTVLENTLLVTSKEKARRVERVGCSNSNGNTSGAFLSIPSFQEFTTPDDDLNRTAIEESRSPAVPRTNSSVTVLSPDTVPVLQGPLLITPEESRIVVEIVPPKRNVDNNYNNNDGASLQVVSSTSSVRKNLFPPHDDNVGDPNLANINDIFLQDDALLMPMDEQFSLEEVIPVPVVVNIDAVVEGDHSETEEREVHYNNNRRKRTSIPSDEMQTRKRKVTPANWIRTKAKVGYNTGEAHVSKRGIQKRARSLKPACGDKCRKKCSTRVMEAVRQRLLDKYWSMEQDKTGQWLFLAKLVKIVPIKKRKVDVTDDEDPWRKHSHEYSLKDLDNEAGDLIPVCQSMFVNTFDISIKCVKTALTKNSPDKRGKHGNHRRLSPLLVQSVKDHIKKFPLVHSHYCRADTTRKYLDENLSVAKMYRMYLLDQEEGTPTATERNYRDIFNTCFNLSFFKPKKDQCSLCVAFDSPVADKSEEKIIEYNTHVNEKQKIRKLKKEDKILSRDQGTKNIRVATFDLQKILYCPKGEIAEFYYKRKLSSFNCTLFDCTVKQGYCYVLDLTEGKKGADEVATFVYDYICTMVPNGITDFRFYSDSCTGQNKNKFLFSMYYYAAMKFNIKITHRWLVKGHTQMECDNVHARIEKKTKNLEIFTPSQWYGNIKSAKVKRPAYIVKQVNKDVNILTFRPLEVYFSWDKVPVTKLRSLSIDSNEPTFVSYQLQCDGQVTKYRVLKVRTGRPCNWSTMQMEKAYPGRLPLKPKLVQDLKWYMEKGFIPEAHLDFFRHITEPPAEPVAVSDDEEEEDEFPQEITPPPGGEIILENPADDGNLDPDDPVREPASDGEFSDDDDD